ncbi:MAG TPA: hypothetical protein VKF15_01100 [Nitrososphaerales archaeon]|nr:hypothetical protein [Nitrososphaerales archaeon]
MVASKRGPGVKAFLLVIVLLLGIFAFYAAATFNEVSSLEGRVSSLQHAGKDLCQSIGTESPPLDVLFSDISRTLQMQIQNDESLIVTLNSTKPAGYVGMISKLNGSIAQDGKLLTSIESLYPSLSGPLTSMTDCVQFNEP